MPVGPNPGESAAEYAAALDQKYPGKGAGASYLAFAAKHPGLTPLEAGDAWALSLGLSGFGAGLNAGAGAVGTAIGQIGTGSVKGASATEKALSWTDGLGNLLTFLTSRQGLVRLAEGALGIALLIVAADHLTSTTSAAGKAAHTLAKGALLA